MLNYDCISLASFSFVATRLNHIRFIFERFSDSFFFDVGEEDTIFDDRLLPFSVARKRSTR